MRRIAVMMALVLCASTAADWPTVRGNAARTGVAPSLLDSRSRVAWRTALTDSPTATCVEPIVAGGRVYVGALNGCVFALDADDGRVLWRFDVGGPVMHSPAWAPGPDRRGRLYVASIDGGLSCLDPATGRRLWQYDVGPGGFVASPTVMNTVIYIGARSGVFYAIRDGRGGPSLLWARDLGAPIWQTAAALDAEQHPDASGVFVMAEDRVARCLDDGDGTVLWASPRAGGQSARDYYPVVAGEWVFFVTRPADGAGAVIAAENDILARASKLELPLDARAVIQLRQRATEVPLKWRRRELFVVGKALEAEPGHQTMWAFRAEDGTPGRVPLLWGAGCGGVMSPPAVTPDGRAVVLWRSWYNGWSYDDRYAYASDSPLRGLGVLDPQTGMLSPLAASQGVGPAVGECFRVTNESAVLQVAGGRLLAVHQGAVTSLNLAGGPLRVILAGHDTWLGEANAPWQGTEWRGPARGGLAVSDGRGYVVCGGYVTCLSMEGQGLANELPQAGDERIDTHIEVEPVEADDLATALDAPPGPVTPTAEAGPFVERLAEHVREYLDNGPYAPRRVLLGESGVYVDFAQSQPEIDALARAQPYLPADLQKRCQEHLLKLMRRHPPWLEEPIGAGADPPDCYLPLSVGRPRESWARPRRMTGQHEPAVGIGGVYGVWLLAERADAWDAVTDAWPSIKETLNSASLRHFRIGLDVPDNPLRNRRGHWAMNRTTAGLIGCIRIAKTLGDDIAARKGRRRLSEVLGEMRAYWSELKVLPEAGWFGGVAPARGDVLLLMSNTVPRPRVAGCRSFAQLSHLRPEVLRFLASDETTRANVRRLLDAIETVGPAWYVTGANAWIQLGANHTLLPGQRPGIMLAMATLGGEQPTLGQLAAWVDLPACPGDWHYVERLVTAIEVASRRGGPTAVGRR